MLMNILLIVVIILAIITSARLMKIFDLTATLRGKKPYEITESENNVNALLMLLSIVGLFGMFFYYYFLFYNDKYMLPEAASEHGKAVDSLLLLNFRVICIAFFITETILMWFAYKYRYSRTRKALHYAHNNKLEMIWTIVPAIVLTVLILRGLIVWNKSTNKSDDPNRLIVEFYARQFDWTARFSGDDRILGDANYTMINADNTLGLITEELIDEQLVLLNKDEELYETQLATGFLDKKKYADTQKKLKRLKSQKARVLEFKKQSEKKAYTTAYDDVVMQTEIHIPVNRVIELNLRSQDVIHSAYLPHFRVHMYCVPGVKTGFTFTPVITTQDMRQRTGKPDFNYLLYCNNICGNAHYDMQMKIVVDTEEDFAKWMKEQKTVREVAEARINGAGTETAIDETSIDSVVTPIDTTGKTAEGQH